ncbi:MAG: PTS sugar transporter subunit IIA [Limisphaerales bacterium]|jgi:excisionase family DNA binding protein
MPFRTLNLEEAAAYLDIELSELKTLVKNGEIPYEQRGDKIIFRRGEIDDWASKRIIGMEGHKLTRYHKTAANRAKKQPFLEALMPELLKKEFIFPRLTAKTKPSVLREMAKLADKTGLVSDVEELTKELIAREELCSTGLPGGIAVLHTRTRHPYMFLNSFVTLGRSVQKIYFGAPDGEPTDLFFLICCKEDQLHLHTLARVCMMARNSDMLEALRAAEDADQMYEIIVQCEQEVIQKKLST